MAGTRRVGVGEEGVGAMEVARWRWHELARARERGMVEGAAFERGACGEAYLRSCWLWERTRTIFGQIENCKKVRFQMRA